MALVLAIEPFYGGSHKSFIDGLIKRSRHEFELLTLPPYFWKWRMRGAALTLAQKANVIERRPDLVLASDMLSLAEFKSLYKHDVPSILYMHENQLSYPLPEQDRMDVHFGITNVSSCLCADLVLWNSRFHMDSFINGMPAFLKLLPDHRPKDLDQEVSAKSRVMPPGIDLHAIEEETIERDGGPPIVLWNHRWEFDKRPEVFFTAIERLKRDGVPFRLCIMGENFQAKPEAFLTARESFQKEVVRFGYVEDRAEYIKWLRRCSVSVSTAVQENFGIAAVEAAYAGASPLWPRRLSYPELMDTEVNDGHLYSDFRELVIKLKEMLGQGYVPERHTSHKERLNRFDWTALIDEYDEVIEETAGSRGT